MRAGYEAQDTYQCKSHIQSRAINFYDTPDMIYTWLVIGYYHTLKKHIRNAGVFRIYVTQ